MLSLILGAALADKGGDPIFGWSLGEWIVGLIVIFVVVVVGTWVLRKMGML